MSLAALKVKIAYRDEVIAHVFNILLGQGTGEIYLDAVKDADKEIDEALG